MLRVQVKYILFCPISRITNFPSGGFITSSIIRPSIQITKNSPKKAFKGEKERHSNRHVIVVSCWGTTFTSLQHISLLCCLKWLYVCRTSFWSYNKLMKLLHNFATFVPVKHFDAVWVKIFSSNYEPFHHVTVSATTLTQLTRLFKRSFSNQDITII